MDKQEMDAILKDFVAYLFGPEIFTTKCLNADQKQQLIQSMMIFVFAHRHSKGDKFIVETQDFMDSKPKSDLHFDFSIVRNVMYLYSKKAQEHYLTFPVESFMLAKFAASKDGQNFIKSKPDNSEKRAKTERIL